MSLMSPSLRLTGTLFGLAASLALLMLSLQVHAQTTQTPEELLALAKRTKNKPEGVVPLIELHADYDHVSPQTVRSSLTALSVERGLPAPRKVLTQWLLADVVERLGDEEASQKQIAALGFLTNFRVIGPFDNEGKLGLAEKTPPERDRMLAPDPHASFPGKERLVTWRDLPSRIVRHGLVPLGALVRPTKKACALAENFVFLERADALSLWFGAGGASVVYWNGEEVMRDEAYREGPFVDRQAARIAGRKGWNRLLVKVCVDSEPLSFYARIGDRRGAPLSGLKVANRTDQALDISPGKLPRLAPLRAPLAELEARAARKEATAQDLITLARYLYLTDSDDRSVQHARQLAAQGARRNPEPRSLVLAQTLASERGDKMAFVRTGRDAFPEDPRVLLMHAQLLATGPAPEDALPVIAAVSREAPYELPAVSLKAAILNNLGLPGAAYAELSKIQDRYADVPSYLRVLAAMADAASRRDDGVAYRKRLLAVRYNDLPNRRALIADALARDETVEVGEHLDVLHTLWPGDSQNLRYIARIYDGLGRDDLSLSTYREAMELAPDSASVHFAYAQALLRAEQVDLAASSLENVLRLSPQHTEARELLEQLKPRARQDERFATNSDEILARRDDGGGHSTTILHRLQVNTVFDNGLGTRFTQIVSQAHDDEGARKLRAHSIQFDPDTQRVDLRLARVYRKDGRVLESIRAYEQQLGEPWYRIYYDTRALVVVFPDLEPGDVVELRYRVDDIAQRNRFADYFGDLHLFANGSPTKVHEYVLVTPKTRHIYTNKPQMARLKYSEEVQGEQRVQRWRVVDVPALLVEEGMPGATEVSPYLHASTYESWEDVGHWYWGLIHDQLYADDALKAKVAELIAGQKTTFDKVRKIHGWVIDHTRYVGLEFGIHGFMPYRVPLIVQRGFGDCKDKASLLYTMFREAGIDARVVLVRTRRNGSISDLPASLAVFDHAIAYVPELKLFIDGTAEYSGATELPTLDQGANVLVVGPNEARFTKTPTLPPEEHAHKRVMNVTLHADGTARVTSEDTLIGTEAAGYRAQFEAPGTRRERFERSLATSYPGLTLHTLHFDSLTDRDSPVRYHYDFSAPEFARREGQAMRVSTSAIGDLTRIMALSPTRVHALDLQSRSMYEEQRTLSLPAGYEVASLPSAGEISSPFFSLTLELERKGQKLICNSRFTVTVDRVESKDYPAFREQILRAERLLSQRIVLKKVAP